MNIDIGDTVLITADNWFYAPDGLQYKAVWGTLEGVYDAKEMLGIRTNAKSTNWYVKVGNMVIAGCQIHYAIKSEFVQTGEVKDVSFSDEHGSQGYIRPGYIYNADNPNL